MQVSRVPGPSAPAMSILSPAGTISTLQRRIPARIKHAGFSAVTDPFQFLFSLTGECPICAFSGRFMSFGIGGKLRRGVLCPRCASLERHRLLWMALTRAGGSILAGKDVVHFAAEPALRPLAAQARSYRTADLQSTKRPDLVLDICGTGLEDATLDVVIANHVMEHIPADDTAFREIFRILRPGGVFVSCVPMTMAPTTYEDPAITTNAARALHYGQWDHVRYYGMNYPDRLAACGFDVQAFRATPQEEVRHRLGTGEPIYFATRPSAALAPAL